MKPNSRSLTPALAVLALLSLLAATTPPFFAVLAAPDSASGPSLHRLHFLYDKATGRQMDDPTVLTQTLFMFNNANPEDRRRLVSDNYHKTHISVQLYNAGSYKYTEFFNQVQNDIDMAFAELKSKLEEK